MWFAVIFLVGLIVAYSMIPKPEVQKPAGLSDVTAPTAEVGREIPVLFGQRDMAGPNVVWYGDFSSVAIKKKGGKK
jgi:hypothetical protein